MRPDEQKPCAITPRAEIIAQLNDTLRIQGQGGHVMVTGGVRALRGYNAMVVAGALANYDGFDPDNDPHGERDFGDLTLFSADLLWKIDYYDLSLEFASPDPADPEVTIRVLTIMLASEW